MKQENYIRLLEKIDDANRALDSLQERLDSLDSDHELNKPEEVQQPHPKDRAVRELMKKSFW